MDEGTGLGLDMVQRTANPKTSQEFFTSSSTTAHLSIG
jgi:hypothetical protein